MTTAVPVGVTGPEQHAPRGGAKPRGMHRFVVMALDRTTGKTVWERVAREQEPHEGLHFDNGTWASSSPITDGERVFAYFVVRAAYDVNGSRCGRKISATSACVRSSARIDTGTHGNTLVIVWDQIGGESFVVALDKRDGKELGACRTRRSTPGPRR